MQTQPNQQQHNTGEARGALKSCKPLPWHSTTPSFSARTVTTSGIATLVQFAYDRKVLEQGAQVVSHKPLGL